jgi:uncharacterized protein (TIGR02996 family)
MGLWDRIKRALSGVDPALTRERVTLVPLEAVSVPTTDDPTAWSVFHDWLEERGDVRAELLRRFEQRDQFDEFVRANAAALLGSLAGCLSRPHDRGPRTELAITWRHGLPTGLSFRPGWSTSPWPWVEQAWRLPFFSTVDTLGVGINGEREIMALVDDSLWTHASAQRLRTLTLGDFTFDEYMLSCAPLGELGSVWRRLPALEQLTVRGFASLGDIDAPALREFTWVTFSPEQDDLESLARARWPRLEAFTLWTGDDVVTARRLSPVFAALPAGLVELNLVNGLHPLELVEALAQSPLARRLERLALSHGTLGDEAARWLLDHRDAFPALTRLDVSHSYVTAAVASELGRWVPTVADELQEAEPFDEVHDGRFVSVSE